MKLDTVHHVAIIARDYQATLAFYVEKLGFELVDDYIRPDKQDRLLNLRQGQLILEVFIKPEAPLRPPMPQPEHTGLRHLAFQVEDVEACLAEFDRWGIDHEPLRRDDFNGKNMAFFFDPDGLPLEIHE